jgi:hypothetical protein
MARNKSLTGQKGGNMAIIVIIAVIRPIKGE